MKFKSRLVARGNLQSNTAPYTERYAPVACLDLVRILLVISAARDWDRCQLDVTGAFLYSSLPEDMKIWVRLPVLPGVPGADGTVRRLLKSLYGLRKHLSSGQLSSFATKVYRI